MIIYDFETFKYDWLVCWLDTETKKIYSIVNDKHKLEKFYEYYKNRIWVGYNSRNYDVWIAKAILCDFNPYDMSQWIIEKDRKGFEFSRLLNNFPIINYDCAVFGKSLKQLEGFMGHDIRESSVPFDIDRPLTKAEIEETIKYCKHDVMETFEVFLETKDEFESHMGLIKEFNLPLYNLNKTKAQISAHILGAVKKQHNDEFDISIPNTTELGKYEFLRNFYTNWATIDKDYNTMSLDTTIFKTPHTFGIGGIHGGINKYMGDGYYLMADVSSYYPALMIEYNFLSRNVVNPEKYKNIRDERLKLKKLKDPREYPRKIVLNSTFGASKDQYNNLYDPLQFNNVTISGQLFLVDLLDKLENSNKCELIQSNTDGILIKLFNEVDKEEISNICKEWCIRTRMGLEFDEIERVIQRDVNNYIIVGKNGKVKRKGAVVKKLSNLDNDLPIVNQAVVDYFLKNIKPEETILNCNELIKFQKITKIGGNYDYAVLNGKILKEKVNRVFASKDYNDGLLQKKHKNKNSYDKIASTPERCFINNDNILEKEIPKKLDKQWYIDLSYKHINEFV